MHFTSLRLSGFKSFVDPTELAIAPGLTGVVGPNGCGKSNLVEALRWVMGESRSSVMRGDAMEDVIFAGAASRPARNHAEVALRLDNADRQAPAGFNDTDAIEIIRRIVRDAGSVYRSNGRETRARDVQMLFADASSGAHSPSLVRQGQIAELINARPRARRRVLEEAAGISGLYQRRHEIELKLRATEVNLGRVGDLLDALEAQRAALARQARAAGRYREVAEALRRAEALLVLRHWQDAEAEQIEAQASLDAAVRAAAIAQAAALEAARARDLAETALPGVREEDMVAATILQRATIEQDRVAAERQALLRQIATDEAALAQLEADKAREVALDADACETIARLAAERSELARACDGEQDEIAAARSAADAAGERLLEFEAAHDAQAQAVARVAADHEAATRAVSDARRRAGGAREAAERAGTALAGVEVERGAAIVARAAAARAAEAARAAHEDADGAMEAAEVASVAARDAEAAAARTLATAQVGVAALRSEAEGLDRLLARSATSRSATSGAQILDRMEVEGGFESALGAATGEDLAWPAITRGEDAATGWWALAPNETPDPLPPGAAPLAARVVAPPALARRLACVGVVAREQGGDLQAELRPGQSLVSLEGDLWRWDGLRIRAEGRPSAAALRLRQMNRRREIGAELARAETALGQATAEHSAAASRLRVCLVQETDARAARRRAEQTGTEASRALARAETEVEGLDARAQGLRDALHRHGAEADEAQGAVAAAEAAAIRLADPEAARAALADRRMAVEAARIVTLTRRTEVDERVRAAQGRARRADETAREIARWQERAETATARLADLDRRAARTATALAAARLRPADLERRQTVLAAALEAAEARRRAAADALAQAESALRATEAEARATERAASAARETRAASSARAEAADAVAEAAGARLRAEAGCAPGELRARLDVLREAIPAAGVLEREAEGLRRQRDGLGPVNLRAEQDAREVATEIETLARERDDLDAAIAKLRQGIAGLNREGRGRLLRAFETVNRNFGALFKHLFGGGEAALVLVENEDPLEAGLEIMCQPPGKKLSTLSLLSGGEQTLTALSLIFAVFLANPAPICVLDEVDAPLDDANVARFCDLLDEMTGRTQTRFLIITHHAVTMSRMDRLYGVTMAEPGVSQLVSVDLAGAERVVAAVV